MTSQFVGDVGIDTKQSCDQQTGSCTHDPGKPGSRIQDPGGKKTWIFNLTTIGTSHTSQNNHRAL